MKDHFELQIAPDGTITTIYQENLEEDLACRLGATVTNIGRASCIEWEDRGWTIRSAKNPFWAVRWQDNSWRMEVSFEGELVYCATRKIALEIEEANFWKLLTGGKDVG